MLLRDRDPVLTWVCLMIAQRVLPMCTMPFNILLPKNYEKGAHSKFENWVEALPFVSRVETRRGEKGLVSY